MAVSENDGLEVDVGLTERKYLQQLARIEARSMRAATKAEKAFKASNTSVQRGFNKTNAAANVFAGNGLRQVSMQLSQVAQQASATGDPIRALAIQLPDLGLAFGTVGIAAGVLGGALLPLITDMLSASDASGTLEDNMDALTEAMSRHERATQRMGMSYAELSDQFGVRADKARQLFEIQRQMAALEAQRAINNAYSNVASGFDAGALMKVEAEDVQFLAGRLRDLKAARDELNSQTYKLSDREFKAAVVEAERLDNAISDLQDAKKAIGSLTEALGVSVEEGVRLSALFAEIGGTDNWERRSEIAAELVAGIGAATNNLSDANDETVDLYNILVDVTLKALELSGVDLSSNITSAANEADRLARNLELARQGQIRMDAARRNPDYFDPRNESGRAGETDPNSYDVPLGLPPVSMPSPAAARSSSRSRSGGGGGSASRPDTIDLDQEVRQLERRIEALGLTADKVAELTARYRMLDEARRKGIDLDAVVAETGQTVRQAIEEKAAAVGRLTAELENAETAEKTFNDRVNDLSTTLTNVLMQTQTFREAAADIFRSLARDIIEAGIKDAILSQFPSGGSGSGRGLFGTLLGGLLGRRASGGPVSAGMPYQVNERTPNSEIMVPSRSGGVLNVPQAQAALRRSVGGSGPVIHFAPVIDARGADQAAVARIEEAQRQMVQSLRSEIFAANRDAKMTRADKLWR